MFSHDPFSWPDPQRGQKQLDRYAMADPLPFVVAAYKCGPEEMEFYQLSTSRSFQSSTPYGCALRQRSEVLLFRYFEANPPQGLTLSNRQKSHRMCRHMVRDGRFEQQPSRLTLEPAGRPPRLQLPRRQESVSHGRSYPNSARFFCQQLVLGAPP
jgi:hypothetical protein